MRDMSRKKKETRGRKPKGWDAVLNLKVPPVLKEAVRKEAEARGVHMNELIVDELSILLGLADRIQKAKKPSAAGPEIARRLRATTRKKSVPKVGRQTRKKRGS